MTDGGYVVATGGEENCFNFGWGGCLVGVFYALLVVILLIVIVIGVYDKSSGYSVGLHRVNSGPAIRFVGQRSDEGFRSESGRNTKKLWSSREPFSNSREVPYYPNASNRTLRAENREKEAVRALGKINQERMRRNKGKDNPLPWGPFWNEWKKTHPLDAENEIISRVEGFAGERERNLPFI